MSLIRSPGQSPLHHADSSKPMTHRACLCQLAWIQAAFSSQGLLPGTNPLRLCTEAGRLGSASPSAKRKLWKPTTCCSQPQFPYVNKGELERPLGAKCLKTTDSTSVLVRKPLRDETVSNFANKEIDHKQWFLRTSPTRVTLNSSLRENIREPCWFAQLREKSGPPYSLGPKGWSLGPKRTFRVHF